MTSELYPKVYLSRRIVQSKLFIDNNYPDKIDLTNISDEAHFSKFHFIRLFKSIYCKTPHQYLKYVRIEKAKELLKNGTSISDACFSVGFNSISSFSGLFNKVVGESPSSFSKRHLQAKNEIRTSPFTFIPNCYALQNDWTEIAILKK